MYYVYVLKNKERGIYIGYTANLKRRIGEHNKDHKGYTGDGEWECVYYEAYKDERDAKEVEMFVGVGASRVRDMRERVLKESGNTRRWLKEHIQHSLRD